MICVNKKEQNYTQNRELSWLRFNQRVLEEAQDSTVPLLERMKFVAIFTSNLDEFFMIRVGSLFDMVMMENTSVDVRSGMNAREQLDAIYDAVGPMYKERDRTYKDIKKQLAPYGVCGLSFDELEAYEKKYVKQYFKEQVLPVLSPQIVDANHPFPHLLSNELYVIANLTANEKTMIGIVPVPKFISDIIYLPGDDIRYIRMEKVIMEYLELIFEQYEVTEENYLCVTRNADIVPDDDAFDIHEDFRYHMRQTLHKRRKMAAVRLEVANTLSKEMESYLCEKLHLAPKQIYKTKVPMKLDYIYSIIDNIQKYKKRALVEKEFSPQPSKYVQDGSVMRQVKKKDVLLSYPYESMEPFLQLVKEASVDPTVLTIKITIYRLAQKTRLVQYLCAAAENGKEVTVLIELRARFDEQNNIDWSERLEEAGCRVIYGFEGYKVHSKVCQITYRVRNEIQYITQIGTGNYNEKTAASYADVSLLTANKAIGEDASLFFKKMSIGNLDGQYKHLIVAPTSLKKTILALIDQEIAKGADGRIIMKMNSVTDMDFIEKMKEASQAGVKIDLIVRGICCILPGIDGVTENLSVTSIVGRYLEHARIFSFGTGKEQKLFIGSADMMTRNTEKRVEVACPILDATIKERLNHMLDIMLADNTKARKMLSDGSYILKEQNGERIVAQEIFMKEAMWEEVQEAKEKRSLWKRIFESLALK